MKREIVWEWAEPPVDRGKIKEVEDALGVRLPDDYITCAMQQHGGEPSRNRLDFAEYRGMVFMSLLPLTEGEDPTLLETFDDVEDRLPEKVVPFGSDPFGNLYCFDYRGSQRPSVIFWNHEKPYGKPEESIAHVANSFTEFLDMLHEPEEE